MATHAELELNRETVEFLIDKALDEWNDALQHAEASWNDHTADYLIGTPLLADYLAEGLEQFALQENEED